MDKRPSPRRFDYLGADTYGWPLPARQDAAPRRPPPRREHATPPPGRPALVVSLDNQSREDSLSVMLLEDPARARMATAQPKSQQTAPDEMALGTHVPTMDMPPDTPTTQPDLPQSRPSEADETLCPEPCPSEASQPEPAQTEPVQPIALPLELLTKPEAMNIIQRVEMEPSIPLPPQHQDEEDHLISWHEPTQTGETAVRVAAAQPSARPPRQQAPSPFRTQQPQPSPPRRHPDIWAEGSEALFQDWRRVLEAATPAHHLLESSGEALDYPPIAVDHRDEHAGRLVLRLYAGERSSMTLAQTYAYYSICFEEDCPRLAGLIGRLANEVQTLALTLGKLTLAFGVDPRPRVLMAQRSQYWNGSYVRCVRKPKQALLELMELERMLMSEIRRFLRQNQDAGAAALLARALSDAQRRTDTLSQALATGCG